VRWRWSVDLPEVERTAEVARAIDDVYAEFRGGDELTPPEILLVEAEPPHLLTWELELRGLRGARLSVELEPIDEGATRVTSRLRASVVGRLRFRRTELAESYAAVVTELLDRACASLDRTAEQAEPTGAPDG
jgi:hypothetical protein